jgi:hypothetical protein
LSLLGGLAALSLLGRLRALAADAARELDVCGLEREIGKGVEGLV